MQPNELTVVPAVPAVERFTIGLALSRSGRIWLQNLPLFLGVALLAHVPEFVLSYPSIGNSPGLLGQRTGTLPTFLLGYVVTGLVTYSVLERLRGRRPSARKSLWIGIENFGPLFGTALLTSLMIGGLLILLVVPGIIASIRWMLVSPIVVAEDVEDPRIRSSALTAGHRGELFGLQAVIYLGLVVVAVLVGLALPEEESVLGNAIGLLPSAVFISFRSVVEGVTYFLLRSEKEGVDVEQLTAVFE
jgi:hypothetical protein